MHTLSIAWILSHLLPYFPWNYHLSFSARKYNGTFHFLSAPPPPTPPKDGRNPNPQFIVGTLWKMKSEGYIFCPHLWKKNPKGPNFVGLFEEKFRTLLGKNSPSLGGVRIKNGMSKHETFPKSWSKIIKHCFHIIKPVLTAYNSEHILLFHFQKNPLINSYCFLVVISFLRQLSNFTCRHVFNFAAIERSRPSPPPHHTSLKSWGRVSPPFLL